MSVISAGRFSHNPSLTMPVQWRPNTTPYTPQQIPFHRRSHVSQKTSYPLVNLNRSFEYLNMNTLYSPPNRYHYPNRNIEEKNIIYTRRCVEDFGCTQDYEWYLTKFMHISDFRYESKDKHLIFIHIYQKIIRMR